MTLIEEQQATARAQAGDAESFGLLYDAYAQKIHAYLYYRTHHRETAEDLASKAFLKALEKLGTFDAAKGGFGSWLYRIAHNLLVDHYRGDKPTADIEDVWDALRDTKTDLARDTDAKMKLAEVEKALAELPAGQREVVVLRVWDGLSYAEIAAITGKSEAASKMAFSRAAATLKDVMPLALLAMLLANPLP